MESATLPPSAVGRDGHREDGDPVPGVVVVFSAGAPCARAIALDRGPIDLGRGSGPDKLDDGRVSRRHARIAFDAGRCTVTDLASQNGSFVDGERATPHAALTATRVIRLGDSLLIPLGDVRPYQRRPVRSIDGFVRGPAMQAVLEEAARAARSEATLHVCGETGTGKEGVVQAFHQAGPRAAAPLVAVNCATIPSAIAERLLFGARRGAYSGAQADASGHVEEAHGGTLFLDEVAELDLQVQAKLLRVLESKEVLPLGASKPRKVEFALCSATHKDLRALVAAGAFREDLYFRMGRPAVNLPALRNRPEEIPELIAHALGQLSPPRLAHVSLVEQCLLRAWPGNVRELIAELRIAADAARTDGARVDARHLATSAGAAFGRAASEPASAPSSPLSPSSPSRRRVPRDDAEWRQRITEALRDHEGNVTAAARALGLHRTQLRRLVERYGIQVTDGDADSSAPERD